MADSAIPSELERLARAAGVQTSFVGHDDAVVHANIDSVIGVLKALGHEIERAEDAATALQAMKAGRQEQLCEPALVVRSPSRVLEIGQGQQVRLDAVEAELEVDGECVRLARGQDGFVLPEALPVGAYTLHVRDGGRSSTAVVLVAPRCWQPPERALGLMLPLYAMRVVAGRTLGMATYTDLARVAVWGGEHGASLFGTLPLLASFLDEPFEPSPYAPVSREKWNELYVDFTSTPEFANERARAAFDDHEVREAAQRIADGDLVDYRAAWRVVRRCLATFADEAFGNGERRGDLMRRGRTEPALVQYAAFRAWCEHERCDARRWSQPVPDLPLDAWLADSAFRAFFYGQCVAEDQLSAAQRQADAAGGGLYLDLPVGAAPGGFDTWRDGDAYAEGFTIGAPPDAFFAQGQNWGFRPPNPAALRRQGYRTLRQALAAHMSRCSAVRIDHVMMLHRLFWIPEGGKPADGVYVRYPSEELYASVAIESHRNEACVVGEDLGVVPTEVEDALRFWGMLGMMVAQFEFGVTRRAAVPKATSDRLACMNTHDTTPFAAFWSGAGIDRNQQLGVISQQQADEQRRKCGRVRRAVRKELHLPRARNGEDAEAVFRAIHERLAAGDAAILLVALEDLWLETRPQNIPGLSDDRYPNWRRRIAFAREQFVADARVGEVVERLAIIRGRGDRD